MTRPRAICGIQARCGSTRLPRKVLADVGGRRLIERVVARAREAERVDEVVVLTSTEPSDDELCAFLEGAAIPYRRGPLRDVLARYLALAEELEPAYLVRVTGDCPLIEPRFIDLQLAALAAHDADFTWVAPGGTDGTLAGQGAFSTRALSRAAASVDPRDREHVASVFFQRHAASFRHVELNVDPRWRRAGLRLAVDEPADLAFVSALVERVERVVGPAFALEDVLAVVEREPELLALNGLVVESADNRAARAYERLHRPALVGSYP